MKLLIVMIFLACSFSSYASGNVYGFFGKQYNISNELKADVQEIRLNGIVLSGVVEDLEGFKKVQKLLRRNIDIKFILNSGGGYQTLFDQFGKSLKKACDSRSSGCYITTYVSSASECSSACIPLFMYGDTRKAGRDALFGFHQAALIPGSFKVSGKAENDLEDMGVDRMWLQAHKKMFETLNLTRLNPEQLEGSNIVTIVVN